MCGRFARKATIDEIQQAFAVDAVKTDLAPSYNIAPTQAVAVIVQSPKGKRGLVQLKWGLIPHWSKDPGIASKLINARSESAFEKPSFKESWRKRRCLIIANGFYEWQKGSKTPLYVRFTDQSLVAFAGLYDFWQASPETEKIASCTILTTQANAKISQFHERMPVVLNPEQISLWLDPYQQDLALLQSLMNIHAAELTEYYPVSSEVNKVSFNQPEALIPVAV